MATTKGGIIFCNGSEMSFVEDVKTKQGFDHILVELTEAVLKSFSKGGYGVLIY